MILSTNKLSYDSIFHSHHKFYKAYLLPYDLLKYFRVDERTYLLGEMNILEDELDILDQIKIGDSLQVKKGGRYSYILAFRSGAPERTVARCRDHSMAKRIVEIYRILTREAIEEGAETGTVLMTRRLDDDSVAFFPEGTPPHTYHKRGARIEAWRPDEFRSMKVSVSQKQTKRPTELLQYAASIYRDLFLKR